MNVGRKKIKVKLYGAPGGRVSDNVLIGLNMKRPEDLAGETLYSEVGRPNVRGMSDAERYSRLTSIEPKRVCLILSNLTQENNRPYLFSAEAEVVEDNDVFSANMLINRNYSLRPREIYYKDKNNVIITWDLVCEPIPANDFIAWEGGSDV